eukprot:7568377-Heterocapsa_arctica.AAC.1
MLIVARLTSSKIARRLHGRERCRTRGRREAVLSPCRATCRGALRKVRFAPAAWGCGTVCERPLPLRGAPILYCARSIALHPSLLVAVGDFHTRHKRPAVLGDLQELHGGAVRGHRGLVLLVLRLAVLGGLRDRRVKGLDARNKRGDLL